MAASVSKQKPPPNPYRGAVFQHLVRLFATRGQYQRALDFGSGDGWFAQQLNATGVAREVVAVDVLRRRDALVEPLLYDGQRLPFPDRSFDLVYAIDVLHHCPDPAAGLREILRVSRGDVALKDHTFDNLAQRILLAFMDELGNRRFGVRSLYRYQRGWEWLPAFAAAGFHQVELRHPLACDPRLPWRWWAPRLQFLGLWERGL